MDFNAGLILEGGGMRCVYTAGVLDFFMDAGIWLSHCYGVSAGAVNATNYLSHQRGRTFRITANYINDKRYCSAKNLLTTGDLFGADFLYNRIPNELDPFDYKAFETSDSRMTAVVTNVDTGKPEYKSLTDLQREMQWLRASCSLPLLAKIVELEGGHYLDGGISNSIPLLKSMQDGNRKNIVILTRHGGYQKQPEGVTAQLGSLLYRKYPQTLAAGKRRHIMYNRQLELVAEQERLGNALVLRPKEPVTIGRAEKDTKKLTALYEQGYADAKEKLEQIMDFLMAGHNVKNTNKKRRLIMCNCNLNATSLTTVSKEASAITKEINEAIRENRTDGLADSLVKQQEYAKKGLLVAHSLKIPEKPMPDDPPIFDSSCYGFLNDAVYDTIHPNLQDHALINGNMGLFRVNRISAEEAGLIADGKHVEAQMGDVFQIRGYDLANMTVVMGETGWIVMDVLTSEETAKAALQLLQEHVYLAGQKDGEIPIKAIIYSHSHADHYAGVGGLITENDYKKEDFQIYAPQGFMENAISENVYAGNAMSTRAAFMYGTNLPQNEKGQVDAGLGKATSKGIKTLFAPKVEISFKSYKENCNYQEIEVDGIFLHCQLTPGTEAPSEMNVYLPNKNVLFIAENCCGTLHNLYTLRGAEVRDALTWANYLDETIVTFSDVQTICSSHNWPQFSENEIDNRACIEYLKKQRNIYRYLGNTTLNLINKGYTIEEVGRKMEIMMPAPLMDEWRNHGFYGSINHNAKAIYQKYIGWYDGNPSNLNKLMPVDAATNYVDSMGGAQKVLLLADTAFKNGEYAWTAELLNRLIFARVRHCDLDIKKQAKMLNADALEQLGYQSESAPWRNEYLTAAMVLRMEACGEPPQSAGRFELEGSIIESMSPEMLMQFMSIMFDSYEASKKNVTPCGYVTFVDDENIEIESITYEVSDGVLTCLPYKKGDDTKALGFSGTKMQFYHAIMGTSDSVITANFKELCDYVKPFTLGFSIVSPSVAGADDKKADSIAPTISQDKRIKIFQAAHIIEQYEEQVVALGNKFYKTTIAASKKDKETWQKLRDEIATSVKHPDNPVDDTMFFNTDGTPHDEWGLGCDCTFNKLEYAHFLCECYKNLYIDAPKTPGLLAECIKMLESLVKDFKGHSPMEQKLVDLDAENKKRWINDFYPILVGHNIIADSMFVYPTDDQRHQYGIGSDGGYDLTELSNVLMRCYKAAMVDELYRLYKEFENSKK